MWSSLFPSFKYCFHTELAVQSPAPKITIDIHILLAGQPQTAPSRVRGMLAYSCCQTAVLGNNPPQSFLLFHVDPTVSRSLSSFGLFCSATPLAHSHQPTDFHNSFLRFFISS
jgi:hypothetical protein